MVTTRFRLAIPVDEKYQAVKALENFMAVSWLDDAWTESVSIVGPSPDDLPALRRLSDEMTATLEATPRHAAWLEDLYATHGSDLEDGIAQALEDYPLESAEKFEIYEAVGPGRDFAANTRAAARELKAQAPAASKELQRQISRLESRGSAEGDIAKNLKCALLFAAASAALALEPVIGEPGSFSTGILAMIHRSCPNTLAGRPRGESA